MCYTVVVALKRCVRGHPHVSANHRDQRICWRQCNRRAAIDEQRGWEDWSLCVADNALDHTSNIPVVDENAVTVLSTESCPTCRLHDYSPEVQAMQRQICTEEENLGRVRSDINNLNDQVSETEGEVELDLLQKAIDVEEQLFAQRHKELMDKKTRLEVTRKLYGKECEEWFVKCALEQRTQQRANGEEMPACVYFGRQHCERERLDMKRREADDWPAFFPPMEALEEYIEDGDPAIVPL